MIGMLASVIPALLPVLFAAQDVPRPAVFVDFTSPPLAFAASELSRASTAAMPQFGLDQIGKAPCEPCFVIRVHASLEIAGMQPLRLSGAQSYSIRRFVANGRTWIAAIGADAAGAMYGGLDLAEAVRHGTLSNLQDSDHAPHIARRGIKFNAPLDVRTPSYSDNSDAAQGNIPEMWSLDFWHTFLDDMARHRFNVISLWNLHPFPSMVRVPEFPDVALRDVQRTRMRLDETFSHRGVDMLRPGMLRSVETVRTMRIEDKIRFWREVMQYAKDRGIDFYVITWNIFTFGTEGKYGITPDQNNPRTIEYFRASVREMVLTYPLLAGIGITAGEQMSERKDEYSKEKWLWKTYGEGIRDALRVQPGRNVTLIHRFHETGGEEIFREFRDYPGPFDLSFKYSIAHMYSIPDPPYIHELLPVLPAGKRTWLTVRNDDVYSFRWADPAFARAYVRNIPGPDKIAGFYMGPDGYVWGREFLSKDPDSPRRTVIDKQWFSFALWGRLSYEPELPDDLFRNMIATRFPGVDAKALSRAWASASQVFPLITRFFWGDIDLKWFPEACLSHPRHRGYYTVRDFVEGQSMPGSKVLPVLEWRGRKLAGESLSGITGPLEIAAALEAGANTALQSLDLLRRASQANKEYRETLVDIEAMAHLGRYYAAKVRAAAALGLYDRTGAEGEKAEAVKQAGEALVAWQDYAAAYASQYRQPLLYNRVGFVDIPGLTSKARDDIEIARRWVKGTFPNDTPRSNAADRPFRR